MRNLWWVLLAVRLAGQGDPAGVNLPAQAIGASDLLAISVYGAPELTRTVRVSDEGLIRLPMLRQKIDVRGRMPAQVEALITDALVEEEILVDPAVSVSIAEYHSRPISVAGAVKGPLTFQALGKTTLLEALTRAQGLGEDAGPEILLTRPGAGRAHSRKETDRCGGPIVERDAHGRGRSAGAGSGSRVCCGEREASGGVPCG